MFHTPIHIINRITTKGLALILGLLLLQIFCSVESSAQCTLACNNNVQVALNSSGMVVVTPVMIRQGTDPACDSLGVEVFDTNAVSIGDTVSCEYVGQTLVAHLINLHTGNYCSSTINIIDAIMPTLDCPDVFVFCNASSFSPDSLGYPTATDNCNTFTNADLSYSDTYNDLPCFEIYNGNTVTSRIDRTWTVVDGSNNSTTCIQKIFLLRSTLAEVVFPVHRDGLASPKLICSVDDPADLSVAGEPTIEGNNVDNTGFCEVAIFYSDQTFAGCGGSSRILREWTAFDFCTNSSDIFIQIIDLADLIEPEITCPSDLTLSTLPNDCFTNVLLEQALTTDECSQVDVTIDWDYGTGLGPHPSVPIGNHEVTYTATDECGNVSTCIINVFIEDSNPPTPICENNLSVSLLPSGTARIYASVFDEGTHDNCEIDRFEVSRDGLPFADFVDFYCADIDNPVSIHFRAFDIQGLYNDCWITVTVNDNYFPNLTCPSDITLSCEADLADLSITGTAITSDACGLDTLYYTDDANLQCGVGTISREWKAMDQNGNMSSCIQIITTEDNNTLNVTFPSDIDLDLCVSSTDPGQTGEPLLNGEACKNVAATHIDEVFSSTIFCYTIVRSWTVINWCVYDPNSGSMDGFYEADQVINVTDNSLPLITCPADLVVFDTTSNCSGALVNISLATATDCDPNISITNNSVFANLGFADASGFYPNGIHTIVYTATDNCGNSSTCSTTIEVKDTLAPAISCLDGITTSISPDGTVTITPEILIDNASDNCTAFEDLVYSVSPNSFTCDDLGLQNVIITVTDLDGNTGSCSTEIEIQDINNHCISGAATVAGKVLKENGALMEDIEVYLSGAQTAMTQTDINGDFAFEDLPTNADYILTPERNNFASNGVTTYDLVLIQQHILGIAVLDSPYKMIAADANNSGSITTYDIIQIRQLIIGIYSSFPASQSWRFVDASYVFPDSNNPWLEAFPESHSCTNLIADDLDIDFIAVKIGDVNNNASTSSAQGAGSNDRSFSEELIIQVDSKQFQKNEEFILPLRSPNFVDIMSMQFALHMNVSKLEFLGFENGLLNDFTNKNINCTDSENIRLSWSTALGQTMEEEDVMFYLKFKAKSSIDLNKDLILENRDFSNEVYNVDHESTRVNISYDLVPENVEGIGANLMFQNFPNPVKCETTIPVYLRKAGLVKLSFYNTRGKKLYSITRNLQAGDSKFVITKNDLSQQIGPIFYEFSVDDELVDTRTMILTD